MKRKSTRQHGFEKCPPAQCLYPVADPRGETTATPPFNQRTTSTPPFPMDVGTVREGDRSQFCFESHTNGKLRGGKE